MGYSRKNFKLIRDRFSAKRRTALDLSESRTAALIAEHPELKELNDSILSVGFRIFDAASDGSARGKQKLAEIEREYDENIVYRREFLKTYGYPEDYLDVKFECENCHDEGYDNDGKMCACMKKALAQATYESSGIGKLIKKQSFDNFELKYYKPGEERDNIEFILKQCRGYAENFGRDTSENLLFIGTTGLGKTHLSTSIAKNVIDKGFDVVYDTACNIFDDFEREKFGRKNDTDESACERYFECDLLIIDDLGTELSTQFTVSTLYNLINRRINSEKPMIINTNLGQKELYGRYAERITSRMFGEFSVMLLRGSDIRAQKLDE